MIIQTDDGFWLRDDAKDEMILREVYRSEDYAEAVIPDGLAFDIGGHIGLTSRYLIEHGMSVIAFEPDPGNIEVFEKNAPTAVLMRGAVSTADGHIKFYRSNRPNKATSGVWPKAGYDTFDVTSFDFRRLITEYQPAAIKCDIEGGEYLLDWSDLPLHVKVVVVEMHTSRRHWREVAAPALAATFETQGLACTKRFHVGSGSWPKVFAFKRMEET